MRPITAKTQNSDTRPPDRAPQGRLLVTPPRTISVTPALGQRAPGRPGLVQEWRSQVQPDEELLNQTKMLLHVRCKATFCRHLRERRGPRGRWQNVGGILCVFRR